MGKQQAWNGKQKAILIIGSLLIIAGVYLGFKYIFPIISPFVIAYGVALVIEKPVNRLSKLFRGKKGVASTIIVVLLTAVLFAICGYLLYLGFKEIKAFISNIDYYMIVIQQKTARISMDFDSMFGLKDGCTMDFLCNCADQCSNAFGKDGGSMMTKVVRVSVPFIVNITLVIGGFIVGLMSVVYLSNRLDAIREWRKRTVFWEEAQRVTEGLRKLFNVYFKIELIIMAINATICMIGLFIIKNPYALVLGCLIGFVDALPFFGTGTVLIPWAILDILFHDYTGAVVLILVYLITYFVREIMESKSMGDRLGISPFILLMVIFVGILVYGILGFILGPISYVIIKALIDSLKCCIERGKLENV